MVNIRLETLTDDASNFYIQAFGNNLNGINVKTHLNSGPTPVSKRIAEKFSKSRTFEETIKNTRV